MKQQGWIWASLTALAVYVCYAYFQPSYSYALLDLRYDAHKYAQAYDYFRGLSKDYHLSFPFNTRILMPWLASNLPFNDLKIDFIWLNGLFVILTVGLLVFIWQKLKIRFALLLIGLFWILFHWKGLVRMYLPDPVTADVGGYFWLTLFLTLVFVGKGKLGSDGTSDPILLFSKTGYYDPINQQLGHKNRRPFLSIFGLLLIAVLGTLQKESLIAVLGVTVLWGGFRMWLGRTSTTEREMQKDVFSVTKNELWVLLVALLLAILAYYSASHFFPASPSDWRNHSLISLLRGIKRYILQPELFSRVPISWLFAYGMLWLAILPTPHFSLKFSRLTSDYSLLTTHYCLWLFLSVFGGGDTTRIMFNGMPFVLTFLLLKLNQQPTWVGWYALFSSLPLMRLAELEPDLGRYPSQMQRWCVECWSFGESWGYGLYAMAVLAGYYYLLRRLGAVSGDKTKDIQTHR